MGIAQKDVMQALKKETTALIISCITLYGFDGIPLKKLNQEFEKFTGHGIPFESFGYSNLRQFLLSLPKISISTDNNSEEIVEAESSKSMHIKHLVASQKINNQLVNRKRAVENPGYNMESPETHYDSMVVKKQRREFPADRMPIYKKSPRNTESINDRLNKFQCLENMLPLFYNHQALGDDFFLDIADTKMGYYVRTTSPRQCGLCVVGQTIAQLKERVTKAKHLAPHVIVMIGFNDLILGRNVNNMILDMRALIEELKRRNTIITLVTLIQSPKLPRNDAQINMRMDIFNKALLEYADDTQMKCNVIDMNAAMKSEAKGFRKDFDRLEKVARGDPYKVFSDYGRKVFLSTLKNSLRQVIEKIYS